MPSLILVIYVYIYIYIFPTLNSALLLLFDKQQTILKIDFSCYGPSQRFLVKHLTETS